MRIADIGLERMGGVLKAHADITWEDCDRPPLEFFVQVDTAFEDAFRADPNGFLLAALLPAWHHGERRIQVQGALCSVLSERSRAALRTLKHWFPELGPFPIIEGTQFGTQPPSRPVAASFLSCGIDSLATLRWNLLNVDRRHPAAIHGVISVDYIEGHGWSAVQEARETKRRSDAAKRISTASGLSHIVARTNILALHDDGDVFAYRSLGSVLAAVGYFFTGAFSKVYIAASDTAGTLGPWGSHPLLDPFYSGAHLTIEHDGLHLTRFQKTALVAEWPTALDDILVCTNAEYEGASNCGQCEKCVRTMTALVALGTLSQSQSFPRHDVSVELLSSILKYVRAGSRGFYAELLGPLEACGRPDLASTIREGFASE